MPRCLRQWMMLDLLDLLALVALPSMAAREYATQAGDPYIGVFYPKGIGERLIHQSSSNRIGRVVIGP